LAEASLAPWTHTPPQFLISQFDETGQEIPQLITDLPKEGEGWLVAHLPDGTTQTHYYNSENPKHIYPNSLTQEAPIFAGSLAKKDLSSTKSGLPHLLHQRSKTSPLTTHNFHHPLSHPFPNYLSKNSSATITNNTRIQTHFKLPPHAPIHHTLSPLTIKSLNPAYLVMD